MPSPIASLDANTLAILKTYYNARSEDLTFSGRPLTAMMPKKTDGGGDSCVWPVTIGNTAGVSAQYATAFANASAQTRSKFLTYWLETFSIALVQNTNLELARTKGMRAIVDLMTVEVDGSWKGLANRNERIAYGSGFGDIGVVSAAASPTITLTNRQDTLNFYKGQKVQYATTLATSTLLVAGAENTVLSVDRSAGTVTMTAALVAGVAATVFVFNSGDRQNSATAVPIVPIGLSGYLPFTAPTAGDAVFGAGVDRSVDPDYLAGVRVDSTNSTITEALDATLARLSETDGTPSDVFMSSSNWNKYKLEQENKVVIDETTGAGITVSFRTMTHMGPKGPVKIHSTGYLPDTFLYTLQMDTWSLISVGEMISNPLHNGKVQDLISSDAVLIKNKSIWTIRCEGPGFNAVTKMQ